MATSCHFEQQDDHCEFGEALEAVLNASVSLGSPEDTIALYLKIGLASLGMDIAIVSEINESEDRYTVVFVDAPEGGPETNDTFSLGQTYCSHVLKADGAVGFHKAGEQIRTHPCYENFGLEAYIGAPIMLGQRLFGTVNFSSPDNRPLKFSENNRRLVQLLASNIGVQLTRIQNGEAEADSRRIRETLARQERRYTHLYRNTPAMMHSINEKGVIVEVSDFWLKALGYERNEVIGRKSVEFLTEESRALAEDYALPAFWRNGSVYNVEYQFVRKDGTLIDALLSAELVTDQNGGAPETLAVITEVGEFQALQRELKRSNEELEQFAYVASHDLQEPLRKISIFSEKLVLALGGDLPEDAQKYIEFMTDGARRMQVMVRELLEYSRTGQRELQVDNVDLDEILDELRSDFSQVLGEVSGEIISTSLPTLETDRTFIRQILQNIVSNAIKYRQESRPPRVRVTAVTEDDFCCIKVADNGIGFEPEFADRVFELFQRLHPRHNYDGTGLGLAIVRQAAERLGGRVWADSEPGEGSAFHIQLPLYQRHKQSKAA